MELSSNAILTLFIIPNGLLSSEWIARHPKGNGLLNTTLWCVDYSLGLVDDGDSIITNTVPD